MANENNNNLKKVSRSEKTNAKNLDNIRNVNIIIETLGSIYTPSNSLISKAALLEFETTFTDLSEAVMTAALVEQSATDAQLAAFRPISKRVSLIMKAVRSQNLDAEFLGHLQSNVYRLNGVRINKKTPDVSPVTGEVKGRYSVSRRSYAGIMESLRFFAEQLRLKPDYDPHETEYKSAAIGDWVRNLGILHNAALETKVATRTARQNRNAYVFHETDGIIARTTAFKNYLGYILASDDSRLKQLKSLKFADHRR